jgi:hypothetical protein
MPPWRRCKSALMILYVDSAGLGGLRNAWGADPGEMLVIHSRALRYVGFHAELQVTVLLSPSEGSAQPYRVLRWQE